MALEITHAFESAKSDGPDATEIQPSHWNANHTITLGANTLAGAITAGAAVEIPCTAFGRTVLAATTAAPFGFSTGDVKLSLKLVADSGWLLCNDGTFGNVGSGSTFASLDAEALFTMFFNGVSDVYAPIYNAAGVVSTRAAFVSAANAWASLTRMSLTRTLGRVLGIAGAGSGLTSRNVGEFLGAETLTIGQANLPAVNLAHSLALASNAVTLTLPGGGNLYGSSVTTVPTGNIGTQPNVLVWNGQAGATAGTIDNTAVSGTVALGGSGTALNKMPPTAFFNLMIKL